MEVDRISSALYVIGLFAISRLFEATWPSGKAGACKALIPGSIPGVASNFFVYSVVRAGVAKLVYATDLKVRRSPGDRGCQRVLAAVQVAV